LIKKKTTGSQEQSVEAATTNYGHESFADVEPSELQVSRDIRKADGAVAIAPEIFFGCGCVRDHKERNLRLDAPLSSTQHLGSSRQYWRDIILGVNDGIISTFLLVVGVAGGGLTSEDMLLTAIAGALAGAVSMFAGEYIATKSQNEVMRGEIALEEQHIEKYADDEMDELYNLLGIIGIPNDQTSLTDVLLKFYRKHPESLLKIMIALEFGVIQEEIRSPIWAGLTSCCLFFAGSMPSVLPFAFSGDRPLQGLRWAILATTLALLVVGGIKTWATRGSYFYSSVENLAIAGCGGFLAYAVGLFFDAIL